MIIGEKQFCILRELGVHLVYSNHINMNYIVEYKNIQHSITDFDIYDIESFVGDYDYLLYFYINRMMGIGVSYFDLDNFLRLYQLKEEHILIYKIIFDEYGIGIKNNSNNLKKVKDILYGKIEKKYNNLSKFAKIVVPKPIKI